MKQKLPNWLKRGILDTESTRFVRKVLRENKLNTVCESARCPNKNECYSKNTATFMILGDVCTRNCNFCSVNKALENIFIPEPIDESEPERIANAINKLNLDYIVITSVTRDDLKDKGANHFLKTIKAIRKMNLNIKIEVLTPDFGGNLDLVDLVIEAKPDVFGHNIETVKRLYPEVRPQAKYEKSLELIKHIKSQNSEIYTKSGFMTGFGENYEEITETLKDLKNHNCDIVTIGQYIQPTRNHLKVHRYLDPEEFDCLRQIAFEIGIKYPICAPLVRSSYKAKDILN
ncbi:MAG: lipoyl synthase [bacterium]